MILNESLRIFILKQNYTILTKKACSTNDNAFHENQKLVPCIGYYSSFVNWRTLKHQNRGKNETYEYDTSRNESTLVSLHNCIEDFPESEREEFSHGNPRKS